MIAVANAREQTRARYPDEEGYVERDGVRVFYEVYGDAPTTFLLFPTGPISHSRLWKAQIPYLSRYFRVVTFDPRGNGRSDRPGTPDAYSRWEFAEDGRAVLAAAGAERALLGGLCHGGGSALMLAATYPACALGVFAIAPFVPMLTPAHPHYLQFPFDEELETDEGWAKCNRHYWRRDYRDFLEFFFAQQLPEPHSTKQIEDAVEWGLAGDVEAVILSTGESGRPWESQEDARAMCERVRCPVLVLYGELDGCQPREEASAVVELHRRDPRRNGRRRPLPAGASPGEGERADARVRRVGRAAGAEGEDVDAGAQPPAARALRLFADRARPRAARRRDREGAAEAAPRPRDRLARPAPGDGRARGRGGADPPGERAARERVGAHRERVGRARPACLPGDQADGRDPRRQLHALPRPRARGELRPLDRRRGLGGRLLPAREPGAEVGGVRLADRLRRLAADGRRRRARGVPDHRLQRRDDRAHRPLPQDPRPRRVRRQPRRRRPQLVRERPAGDPRLDGAALRLLRLRDRLRARRRPGEAEGRARVRAARAGLHRHRRRVGRGRAPAPPRDRGVPAGEGERAGAADGRRRRAADRSGEPAAARRARDPRRTCTSSTATSRRATSPSSRAG